METSLQIYEKILKILEENPRATNKQISDMLNLSEEEVEKSIEILKNEKILIGFKAIIDWKKIRKNFINAVIQVKVVPQEREGFARICKEIAMDKRVTDVSVMTGDYDLTINITADNMDEISEFVTEKLATKKGVIGTNTHIILKEFKRDGINLFEEENKREMISI